MRELADLNKGIKITLTDKRIDPETGNEGKSDEFHSANGLIDFINYLDENREKLTPDWRSYFSICCKTGLVVPHSLNFCLSQKLLICLSNLNESRTG